MKTLLLSCAILSVFSPVKVEAGVWDRIKTVFVEPEAEQAPTIRVLIAHSIPSALVEVKGKYNVDDPFINKNVANRFSPRRAYIEPTKEGLKWGEVFLDRFQVKIIPDDAKTRLVVNGIEYNGVLYVYDVGGGKISIINEVPIEDYVVAVLSPMFDHALSKETMNAIAIATRTDAFHHSQHAQNPLWHVQAKQVGYQGYALGSKHNGVREAVDNTRYMVMSQSSAYSGEITTFSTAVVTKNQVNKRENTTSLSVDEVELLASKGKPADKILNQIFPNTTIALVYTTVDSGAGRELAEAVNDKAPRKSVH